MKYKLVATFFLMVYGAIAYGQEIHMQPTQDPNSNYRLFNTNNVYTLLKLDTRSGKIWQIQWGREEERFTLPISLQQLSKNSNPGRFTLYPTNNIYTFVLLDQEAGDTWHVQWGEKGERFVVPIK